MATSFRMKLVSVGDVNDGQVSVSFVADYEDEKNKEWAKYTPGASFSASVLAEVVERNGWVAGKSYEFVATELDADTENVDGSDNA